jgi:hypothetical protein
LIFLYYFHNILNLVSLSFYLLSFQKFINLERLMTNDSLKAIQINKDSGGLSVSEMLTVLQIVPSRKIFFSGVISQMMRSII